MSEVTKINLTINDKATQYIAVFPYSLNSNGKIERPEVLERAIRNREQYATLVYLMGGTSQLSRMMSRHFGANLTTLRSRWGVPLDPRKGRKRA